MRLETATVDGKAATTTVKHCPGGKEENGPDVNDKQFHFLE
jgi:hypothetical protein